jgi:hypothetical protein
MVSLRGPSYSVALSENAGVKEIPPFSLQQDGVTETISTNLVYRKDVWPPLVLPRGALFNDAGSAFASAIGGAATSTPSAVPASNIARQALSSLNRFESTEAGVPSTAAGQSSSPVGGAKGDVTVATHLASQTMKAKVLEQADSLVLGYGVTLMLYSAHTADGQPLGYSVRYIRGSASGRNIADVMLSHAQAPIR